MSAKILVLGATSKIAQEIARLAAADKKELLLVARHQERLNTVAGDLLARGAGKVQCVCADLADISGHDAVIGDILAKAPDFDTILLAYGTLGDQTRAEESPDYAVSELNTNFNSAVSLLTRFSTPLAARGTGCIAVITSVAGDRARRSNYVYGTAKGALSLFTQGLRAKLADTGVRVITIKPGPVATPMTAGMANSRRFARPEAVARTIYRAIERGKPDILYVPFYWRWIMLVIRAIPESIAKRMKF
jgi:short-subunit dehydrogenase